MHCIHEKQDQEVTSLLSGEKLYEDYSLPIYRYLLRYTRDHALAEDLMQETFLRAWKALPRVQGGLFNPQSWLYRIATNVAYDKLRRDQLVVWLSLDAFEYESDFGMVPDPQEQLCEIELVRLAFHNLPESYRKALLLYVLEGYTYEQIAQACGIAQKGVKMYLSRARRKLKEQLQQLDSAYALHFSCKDTSFTLDD